MSKNEIIKVKRSTSSKSSSTGRKRQVQEENGKRIKYQKGTGDIAFVFSCPGRKEEEDGRVCAGKTGENFQVLIEYLYKKNPDVFPSAKRCSYTITNASDIVHYKALTGDTEPSDKEIVDKDNIARLFAEIGTCRIVVCMGNRALFAVKQTGCKAKILKGEHLSPLNLNSHYKDVNGETPGERNRHRVECIGHKILEQLK